MPQDRMKNGINKLGTVWENAFYGIPFATRSQKRMA